MIIIRTESGFWPHIKFKSKSYSNSFALWLSNQRISSASYQLSPASLMLDLFVVVEKLVHHEFPKNVKLFLREHKVILLEESEPESWV